MTDIDNKPSSDGRADAIAATAMIAIVIVSVVFWLSNQI